MRVIVIGGTGLISTPMVGQLLAAGHEVTVANRGRTERPLPSGVRQITIDRKDFVSFEARMAQESFDAAIDMVCFVPEEAESLVRAFGGRVQQLIFCSTVDVYQKPAARYPITEAEPLGGLGDYATNKVRCEEVLNQAHLDGAFQTTHIRPAHTYGDHGGLVHSFGWSTVLWDRIRKGKPIVVHGDGTSLWAACHAEDVSRAFVNAIGNRSAYGNGYHTTSDEWLTWNRYHEIIAEAIGAPKPEIVHIATDTLVTLTERAGINRVNFQFNNIYDNSAAREDLGFRTTISFREGVERMYKNLVAENKIVDSDSDPHDDDVIATYRSKFAV